VTLQDPGRLLAPSAAPASSLPVVRLVADLACPWCYVGLHRLLALAPREPFRLVWHPFLLNPHLPAGGVPRPLYLERKFGGAAQADAVYRRAAATAAAQGLELRLDRIRVQPDTRLAHAALLDAGARLPELVSALFAAFFRDGSDLGDPEVLAALGQRLGFDVPEPAAAAARVGAMHEAACRAGIDGVPVFVFGEDHVIAGAQPSECLAALLRLERYRVSGASGAAAQGRQAS
jgi:predicted DsbA family dithiol-disulfide isomerase